MSDYILKSSDPKLPGWRLRVSREEGDCEIEIAEEIVHPEQVDNPEARHMRRNARAILMLAEARWLRDALTDALGDSASGTRKRRRR